MVPVAVVTPVSPGCSFEFETAVEVSGVAYLLGRSEATGWYLSISVDVVYNFYGA